MVRRQDPNSSQILNQEFFALPGVDCLVMKGVGLSDAELVRFEDSEFLLLAVSEVYPLHLVEIRASTSCFYLRSAFVKVTFIRSKCIRVNKNSLSLHFTGESGSRRTHLYIR